MVAAVFVAVVVGYGSASAQSPTTEAIPGTTITVNTKEDESTPNDGKCSLREAIQNANDNAQTSPDCKAGSATEEDGILFALGKKATITLDSQLPTITDASGLSINGQKAKITISGNDAVRVFQVNSGAEVTLARLTVAHGKANGLGGGMSNDGTLTVLNSTFSGNNASDGGGIENLGTLEVTNSTFSNNSSSTAGGAIRISGGTLEVTNSTFSNNSSQQGGGGIENLGTLEVTNSTFSNNSSAQSSPGGGAIFNGTGRTATLSNTIMANSPSGGNCSNLGTLTDGGYNIDDGTTCGFSATNLSQPSTDPLLDPKGLQNNGGPTKTIRILQGSPATSVIPKGENGCGTEIKTDQRGVKRPKGPGCDIGAFEKTLHVQPNPEPV
jgi:CSLREA domain-containing protein